MMLLPEDEQPQQFTIETPLGPFVGEFAGTFLRGEFVSVSANELPATVAPETLAAALEAGGIPCAHHRDGAAGTGELQASRRPRE